MPSVAQMSFTRWLEFLYIVTAEARVFSSNAGGRPPSRPRAEPSPAIIRSRISSLSNWVIAPENMKKENVVGGGRVDVFLHALKANPSSLQLPDAFDQVFQ